MGKLIKFWLRELRLVMGLLAVSLAVPADGRAEAGLNSDLEQVEALRYSGDYDEARVLLEQVLTKAKETGYVEAELECLFQLALIQYFENKFDEARATMEIGRAQANKKALRGLEADFLSAEGVLEWKLGNLSLAKPKLEAALAIQKGLQEWVNMASISNNLGIIAYSLKDYEEAMLHYRKGIEWLGSHENPRLQGSLYSNLAEVLIPLEQLDEAEKRRFFYMMYEQYLQMQQVWQLRERDLIPQVDYDAWLEYTTSLTQTPGGAEMWPHCKAVITPTIARVVEEGLEKYKDKPSFTSRIPLFDTNGGINKNV